MKKLRLALNKGEELRFLSHLDYAQAVERMIRRAEIKMAYSEGFNPHMKISFSSALALGVTAAAEYIDMDVLEEDSLESIMERLNRVAPPGLEVLDGKEMPEKVKKMMAICNFAIYEVTGPVTDEHADWNALLKPFNEATEISYEKVTPKKTRTIDVKEFVKEPIVASVKDGMVTLTMGIGIYPQGTIKPSEKEGRDRMHKILVNVMREEIRMAVIDEEGQLVDFVLERTDESHMANHMYKGTVKNVLNGMQAAFVDIGGSQNAYLNLQQGKEQKILPRLSVGQQVLVQVVKEEMLGKGARVTADVSLAGRFMVLLPYSEGMHISKKITDEALRAKLQELAAPYVQEGCGFIIRTAAAKASADEIGRDMDYLWRTWQHVLKRFKVAKSGTDLYSDADFWFRLVRDYAHRNVEEIIVDSDMGESRLMDLLGHGPTSQQIKVTRHRDSTPIFKANHIEPQLEDLISRDINLPSGGSIRIDHTEALTVFDVNSAHYTGKSNKLEDLAFTVNKEAAKEICRQLRLRDIGGIIVVDFIDMKDKQNQQELLKVLSAQAKLDKMKTVVCGISSLGLVEMTRKRARQGLQTLMFDTCPQCGGTGYMLSGRTVYMQIVRRIRELFKSGRIKSNLEIEVHPEVAQFLTKAVLEDLGDSIGRKISIVVNPQISREGYSLMAVTE